MEQYDSSPKMRNEISDRVRAKDIPFDKLEVGKSVIIPFGHISEDYLRILVSKAGRNLKRRFSCLKHRDQNIFEIGRLPDVIKEPVAQLQTWDSSPQMRGE